MSSIWRSIVDGAKRWADRRVARQAEIEDVPGVDEPKELPETEPQPSSPPPRHREDRA